MAPGSSPLARGTSVDRSNDHIAARLIPARAGNMSCLPSVRLPKAAHPRSRGEHGGIWDTSNMHRGSSPLARGTYLLTWGFIPYISKIESL